MICSTPVANLPPYQADAFPHSLRSFAIWFSVGEKDDVSTWLSVSNVLNGNGAR